jgi:unsaturated rhamnogalacturonyl hydrolase
MTGAILQAQQPDGLWRTNLADPIHVAHGKTSGSGFFLFALAWGINHGHLDRATHWPAIARGWPALQKHVRADGYVGYVQRIGDQPDSFDANSRREYGTGAFLLACSEVLRAAGGACEPPEKSAFLREAERLAGVPPR